MLSKEVKKLKDPIYGYICVDVEYFDNIIDTPVFQRLRRVMQTSYSPLYSSALHNRFVHSLGVYYLGTIVSENIKDSLEKYSICNEIKDQVIRVYRLACLLHDVGHAPFSHTGEAFYKFYFDDTGEKQLSAKKLHERLSYLVESDEFNKDIPGESASAAPHEIMSAIVGISNFRSIIGENDDVELFARCITGYLYSNKTRQNCIKNCFISMLNSKVIDVDRLDYLIRDAYTSGFETINIDYRRLLSSITIRDYQEKPRLVYTKNALSVIENVVYAHDAEKKWIQNHPVVMYETYIIKHMLEIISDEISDKNHTLFSEKSLSEEGQSFKNGTRISLLCDDDIIYLSKNKYNDDISKEFFHRGERRHPIWKSETEYKAYVSNKMTKEQHGLFAECMFSFVPCDKPDYIVPIVINEELYNKVKNEYEKAKENGADSRAALARRFRICNYLKDYATNNGFPFDYLVLPASSFISNFSKDNLKKTLICIEGTRPTELNEVCNVLNADTNTDTLKMCYLYYRRGSGKDGEEGKITNVFEFCQGLIKASESSESA